VGAISTAGNMSTEQSFQLSREWEAVQKTALWQAMEFHIKKLIENRSRICETTKLADQEKIAAVSKAQGEVEILREILRYPERIISGKIQVE